MDVHDAFRRLTELGVSLDDIVENDVGYYSLPTNKINLNDVERPHPKKYRKITQHYIVIDSRDRNYAMYPTPDKYYIELYEPHRNVEKLELLAVMIPKTEYNVNNSNNRFKLTIQNVTEYITLREGEYTIGSNKDGESYTSDGTDPINGLIAELQYSLNSHPNSNNAFKVLLCTAPPPVGTGNNASIFNRILILRTDDVQFCIDFNVKCSCFRVLGFNKGEYFSSTVNKIYGQPNGISYVQNLHNNPVISTVSVNSIVSIHDYDLLDDPNYIILDIEVGSSTLGRIETRDISTNSKFAVVLYDANDTDNLQSINSSKTLVDYNKMSLTKRPGRLKSLKGSDFDKKVITFIPKVTIENFNIVFTKNGNVPYNFHNREHALIFQIDVCDTEI